MSRKPSPCTRRTWPPEGGLAAGAGRLRAQRAGLLGGLFRRDFGAGFRTGFRRLRAWAAAIQAAAGISRPIGPSRAASASGSRAATSHRRCSPARRSACTSPGPAPGRRPRSVAASSVVPRKGSTRPAAASGPGRSVGAGLGAGADRQAAQVDFEEAGVGLGGRSGARGGGRRGGGAGAQPRQPGGAQLALAVARREPHRQGLARPRGGRRRLGPGGGPGHGPGFGQGLRFRFSPGQGAATVRGSWSIGGMDALPKVSSEAAARRARPGFPAGPGTPRA